MLGNACLYASTFGSCARGPGSSASAGNRPEGSRTAILRAAAEARTGPPPHTLIGRQDTVSAQSFCPRAQERYTPFPRTRRRSPGRRVFVAVRRSSTDRCEMAAQQRAGADGQRAASLGSCWWRVARGSPRALGCSTTIQSFPHGHHVRTEYGVDARLVPRSLVLEPCEDVTVNPKRDRLFWHGVDHDRLGPEIGWQAG